MEAPEEVVLAALGPGKALGPVETNLQSKRKKTDSSASSSNNSNNSQDGGMLVFGLRASAPSVTSFKDGSTVRHGLAVLGSQASPGGLHAGDHFVGIQRTVANESGAGRNCVRFWTWRKDQPQLTCTSPEKLCCIGTTVCGAYIVAGGASGKGYLWESSTGLLLRVWKSHFLAVSALRFLSDASHLVSAGEDAQIKVWNIADLVDAAVTSVRPQATFAEHTLAITDLWCGSFGLDSRILSCSLDHNLKLWYLGKSEAEESGPQKSHLVKSWTLSVPLHCCVADYMESFAFVGASDGNIYECALREGVREEDTMELDMFGDASSSQTRKRRKLGAAPTAYSRVLEGHRAAVSCLALNSLGLILVSGSLDGTCRLWDTFSGMSIKVVNVHGATRPVVALQVVPMPRELAHGHGGSDIRNVERGATVPVLKPLNRYQSSATPTDQSQAAAVSVVRFRPQKSAPKRTIHSCAMEHVAAGQEKASITIDASHALSTCTASTSSHAVEARTSSANSFVAGDSGVTIRLEELQQENSRLKRVFSKLYAIAVDKFLNRYPE